MLVPPPLKSTLLLWPTALQKMVRDGFENPPEQEKKPRSRKKKGEEEEEQAEAPKVGD
jgi:hypothetical protein